MRHNQKRDRTLLMNLVLSIFLSFASVLELDACLPKSTGTPVPSATASPMIIPTPTGIALSFETIERWDYASGTGKYYMPSEPGLIVVAQSTEAQNLDGILRDPIFQQIEDLDYSQYFVIAAFQGRKHSSGYGIQINQISQVGNVVNIFAQLSEPVPNHEIWPMTTSPYHLVKVHKRGNGGQEITFNLVVENKPVVTVILLIP